MSDALLVEMTDYGNDYEFLTSISSAMIQAEQELENTNENLNSLNQLKPECDKIDYMLAVSSGALCAIIDIFTVGKPGESLLGNITDKWFENRTKDFAKMCGWTGGKSNSSSSAIKFLEDKFKIPYDQRGAGDAGSIIFDLTPSNHHFKSLGHNPSLLGLFFSILNQFTNSSHFVSGTQLISLQKADNKFELKGNNISSKLFCGFANWIGHLISDVSGSSGSVGRGMGIPSPLWTWTNDVIALKRTFKIPVSEFDRTANELALKTFNQGFDARFQTAQAIPVFINELVVRLFYSLRRLIKCFTENQIKNLSIKNIWKFCEPFSNPTVKRMLTVAHGTFCLIDVGDATIRGIVTGAGSFNAVEFFIRLNIVGIGRFTVSIYGEGKRRINYNIRARNQDYMLGKKLLLENYIEGLELLSEIYDDRVLIDFVEDFKSSNLYIIAFKKSIKLAEKREVPEESVLKTKHEIDSYFGG